MSQAQPDIGAAALLAFGNDLNAKAPGIVRVAQSSVRYALIDHERGEVVIDVRAVVHAILALGQVDPANAAGWFYEFVNSRTATVPQRLEPRHPEGEIAKAVMSGLSVVLSETMRGALVPRALTIAQMTVGRTVYDLRHLLMSILHQPGLDWMGLGINMSEAGLVNARKAIVAPIAKSHERGERVTVWRQLVDRPPEAPAPASRPARKPAKNTAPAQHESVPIHTDDPAVVDQLGREGFATVLADRIIEARKRVHDQAEAATDEDDNRAFIVHMHGPWGSGKSTVLNFVRRRMENETPSWLVVEFNAWRSQRLAPPWWSLILAVQKAALKDDRRSFIGRRWFAFRWHWMRVRADWVPMIWGVLLLVLTGLMLWYFLGMPWLGAKESGEAVKAGILGTFKEVSAGIIGLVTGVGAVLTFGRSLLFGSGNAAKAYEDLRNDPYTPMMTLFTRLVRTIDRPIIVFIDDLDRCERGYVCDLLENIQTMLRAAPITYLIAADRKWITTSFEKRYADFSALGTDAGRPLGYQFLDKLFQVSATLPLIPHTLRDQFWSGLLHPSRPGAEPLAKADRSLATAKAKLAVAEADSFEQLQAAAKAEADPLVQQAIRAEGARKISTVEARTRTEHRLKPLGRLIESNPRAMKRLANAVAMNLARLQIEGRDEVSFEAAARWTIISLRWPLLADWLCVDTARIGGRAPANPLSDYDGAMNQLLADADVQAVIGAAREKGKLTPQSLAALIS